MQSTPDTRRSRSTTSLGSFGSNRSRVSTKFVEFADEEDDADGRHHQRRTVLAGLQSRRRDRKTCEAEPLGHTVGSSQNASNASNGTYQALGLAFLEAPPEGPRAEMFVRHALLTDEGEPVEISAEEEKHHSSMKVKAGNTVDQKSMDIYHQLMSSNRSNFLEHVKINECGGVAFAKEIWNNQRYLWCAFLYGAVLFNIVSICLLDWMIFQNYLRAVYREFFAEIKSGDEELPSNPGRFFSKSLNAEVDKGDMEVFATIDDERMRRTFETLAALVACAEVLFLVYNLLKIIYEIFIFTNYQIWAARKENYHHKLRLQKEYTAFKSLHGLLQTSLPQLSTFSALKLVGRVHPSLVYTEYLEYLAQHHGACYYTFGGVTFMFVLTRLAYGCVAVVAFAVKLLAVGYKLVHPRIFSPLLRWSQVVALLANCMGAVLFERVLQERIFLFVFGGSDMEYQDEERALRNVYQCRLVKQIWVDFWDEGQRVKAIVLLSTLDHYDLQALIIQSDDSAFEEAVDLEEAETRESTVAADRESTGS